MSFQDRPYVGADRPGGLYGSRGSGGGLFPSGFSGMSGWSINTWIIIINVVVFIGQAVTGTPQLAVIGPGGQPMDLLSAWGHFSTTTALVHFQVWRFITFQFLHAGIWHIGFNMLALFWFGPQVEHYLGSRRYLAFYLLCGIAGAALYLVLNVAGWLVFRSTGQTVPILLANQPGTPLVGASAGIFGVLLAGAYLRPNLMITLLLFFVFPVTLRQKTLAYGLLIIAAITVVFGGSNAGGQAGHLGGAALGALLIREPHWLNWALLLPLDRFKARGFHAFGQYSQPDRDWRGTTETTGPRPSFTDKRRERKDRAEDEQIDRILAKIGTQGLHSLTSKERRILERDTERKRRSHGR